MHVASEKLFALLVSYTPLALVIFALDKVAIAPELPWPSARLPRHVLRRARDSPAGLNQAQLCPLVTKSTLVGRERIVAGVRREGSWKAYCRVEHKRLIRLRSYLVRGYAETTDPLIECVLRLPNGACWNVLAYWLEAA